MTKDPVHHLAEDLPKACREFAEAHKVICGLKTPGLLSAMVRTAILTCPEMTAWPPAEAEMCCPVLSEAF